MPGLDSLRLLALHALFQSYLISFIFSSDHGLLSSKISFTCSSDIQSQTVDIPQSIKDTLRKFRFARRNEGSAALVVKINKAQLVMEEVELFDNISIEELAEGPYIHIALVMD